MSAVLWILVALAALILLVSVVFAALLTHIATARDASQESVFEGGDCYALYREQMQKEQAWLAEKAPERWTARSYDGLTLAGKYLPCENPRGAVLCMHGYHGNSGDDFAATVRFYHERGFCVLLPDQRCHGESEGKRICYGVRERYDCVSWLRLLNERNGDALPVFLHGISMGAATVMLASGLTLPDTVRGVIDDCGFTSPAAEFAHVAKANFHMPKYPIQWFVRLFTRVFAGFDPNVSALDAMRLGKRPALFIHGGADTFVPTAMGRALYEACTAKKTLVIVDDAPHAMCLWVEPDRCKAAIAEFMEDCLAADR